MSVSASKSEAIVLLKEGQHLSDVVLRALRTSIVVKLESSYITRLTVLLSIYILISLPMAVSYA